MHWQSVHDLYNALKKISMSKYAISAKPFHLPFPKISNEMMSSPLLALDTDELSSPAEDSGVFSDTRWEDLLELNLGLVEVE